MLLHSLYVFQKLIVCTIDLVVSHCSETKFHCLRDIEAEQREQTIGRQR